MVGEFSNEDAYADDIAVWEELKDELNDELTAYTALYPTGKSKSLDPIWADDLRVPTYDHDNEEIRLRTEDIDIVIDKLEQRDARRKGFFGAFHETRPRDRKMFSTSIVDRHDSYTVRVEDAWSRLADDA